MRDSLYLEEYRPAKRSKHFYTPELQPQYEVESRPPVQPQPQHLPLEQDLPSLPHTHWQHQGQPLSPSTRPQPQQHPIENAATATAAAPFPSLDEATLSPTGNLPNSKIWPNGAFFDPSWKWPASSSPLPPPPPYIVTDVPREYIQTSSPLPLSAEPFSGSYRIAPFPFTASGIITASPSEFFPAGAPHSPQSLQCEVLPNQPCSSLPAVDGLPASHAEFCQDNTSAPASTFNTDVTGLNNPFRDCVGKFGHAGSQFFTCPPDGKVNGYIKFSWPKRSSISQSSSTSLASRVSDLDDVPKSGSQGSQHSMAISSPYRASLGNRGMAFETRLATQNMLNGAQTGSVPGSYGCPSTGSSPSPTTSNISTDVAFMGNPRLVPAQYGHEAKMSPVDRKLWEFYIKNWCPGRSVLTDTNLWLKDFAQMHSSAGVAAAIQSLAGIYIYDYLQADNIRNRVINRFAVAEGRFTELLQDRNTAHDEARANELITIAVLLSMQDIVLTERRLKRPYTPRWLDGFGCGEYFLRARDHGSRFWNAQNVQISSLRISQSIMVGRGIILAQPMSSLPPPEAFDAEKEARRFGWLLYGTEKDMYRIHGGCGFSKKLLHVLSQITYCAARLQQEPKSPIATITAEFLLNELLRMRQWSTESMDWDPEAKPVVVWARAQPQGFKIDSDASMTDVTAEAWRLAAILYLQCRAFRLPRNHPSVVLNLGDLTKCISIMPTSGRHFTAQAPLFPVFLLGLLATDPEHKKVSIKWFDEVLETPVRSSVPPLYNALKHIWNWISTEIPLSLALDFENLPSIHLRSAWWETLVKRVQEQEQELLCLT